MTPYRSLLFVPGHKRDWIDKALASEADAIIIDLEDAVPEDAKETARANARQALDAADGRTGILVRPNALDTPFFGRDVAAVTHANLSAFLLPKLFSADDIVRFDGLITAAEIEAGIERGTVPLVPSLETAASLRDIDSLLAAPRVAGVMAAAAKNADISRAVGFRWTAEGKETLYLRSRVVLAARAAGLSNILLGLWQDVKDLDGMRRFAEDNCGLGYTGQVLIHPSHVPIANDAYGLDDRAREYYEGLVEAFEQGRAAGHGAVIYRGEHIDLAHANHARDLLGQDAATLDSEQRGTP